MVSLTEMLKSNKKEEKIMFKFLLGVGLLATGGLFIGGMGVAAMGTAIGIPAVGTALLGGSVGIGVGSVIDNVLDT